MEELKKLGETLELQKKAFDAFKKTNDELIAAKADGKGVGELEQKLAKMEKDLNKYDTIQAKMEVLEKAIARGASGGAKSELEEKELEQKAAFDTYLRKGCVFDELSPSEKKAMTASSGPDGGFGVPRPMAKSIETIVFETSPMRSVCSVVQMGKANVYPGIYDDDEAGADFEGLNETTGNDQTPEMGEYTIPANRLRARPLIHEELLEDSMFNLEQELTQKVGDRMSRRENTSAVNGLGVSEFFGFQAYDSAADADVYERGKIGTIESAGSGVLTFDDVIEITDSLKAEWDGNARLAGHRKIFTQIRKLKDEQGQYLWLPSLVVGQPATVNAVPTIKFNDMPSTIAAGAKVLAIADWARAYRIADRVGISVLKDPFTANPFIKYIFRKRVGGQVVNFDAIKRLQIKA